MAFASLRIEAVGLLGLLLVAACAAENQLPLPKSPVPKFGHELLPFFALNGNYTNLNHGSYGAPPKSVLAAAQTYELNMEQRPDAFFRYDVWGLMNKVRALMAKFVGADEEDLAFVPNASHGVNAVLRSLKIKSTQKILCLNVAYAMVKNTLAYLEEFDDDSVLQVNITLPGKDALIVQAVQKALEAHPGQIKVASFSHIVSLPGFILPVKELIDVCHQHGVMVLIDGAHALGQIPLNLNDLNADFWVGNGHKWLYSPKGSAILWARKDRQHLVEPTTISWEGQGSTHYQAAFAYTGTASYSPYLAMADALEFREWLGGEAKILGYMHDLAVKGGKVLAEMFDTDVLFNDDKRYAAMVDVRLPAVKDVSKYQNLPQKLLKEYDTWVPDYDIGSLGGKDGVHYVRVSCQIYNEISDIEYLGRAILALLGRNTPS